MRTTASWHLQLCGSPRLYWRGEPPRTLALSPNDAACLACAAAMPGATGSLAAALVWPDAGARGALNNLNQRIHRLRRATGARLVDTGTRLSLAADLVLDADPLDAFGAEADTDFAEWLAGCGYTAQPELAAWVEHMRQSRRSRWHETLARRGAAAEQAGQITLALCCAERLAALDPLSEHAHRRLMRLHHLRGDRAAAVAAFERCERLLRDELGLKPDAQTRTLLATVERGGAIAVGAARPVPAALLRPPRTVGRADQAAMLADAHALAQVAVLVGEAGIGKTRLLQDFIAAHPQAVYVQARPGDAGVPYGTLARLLRAVAAQSPAAPPPAALAPVAPEWSDGAHPPDAAAPRLQGELARWLAAALPAPPTVAVDDLHFADRASIEMLRALVDTEALAAVRWVFAHRPPAAAGDDAALLRALADAPQARWIALPPLDETGLIDLLDSLALPGIDPAEAAPALARHAGGNPLYVLETLRALPPDAGSVSALPRPAHIEQLIERRLQRLSAPALALARVAAIAVPDFSVELAEHALATPALALADAWRELEDAGVLRGDAFAHDLVHHATVRATPLPVAARAHELVARFLDGRDAEPARVASHFEHGGRPLQAGAAWCAAADRARAAGRPADEAAQMERAAAQFDAAGAHERWFAAQERAGALHAGLGHAAAARRAALALQQRARSDAEHIAALGALMDAHALAKEDAQSLAAAHRLIEAAQAAGDDRAELRGWRGMAAAHAFEGRYEQALAVHETRAGWLRAQPPRADVLSWAIDRAYILERIGRAEEAAAAYAAVAARAIEHGHPAIAYEALSNQVMSTFRLGLTGRALELAIAAERLATTHDGVPQHNAIDQATRGAIERDAGLFTDAVPRLEGAAAAAHAEGAGGWLPSIHDALAATFARLGQHHRAHRLLAEPHDAAQAADRIGRLIQRAQARRLDPARSGGALAAEFEAELAGELPARGRLLVLLELAAERDPGDAALAEMIDLAARHGGPGYRVHARLRRLDVWRRRGADDARLHREAHEVLAELHGRDAWGLYRPEALQICASALRLFNVEAARAATAEARRWIETALHRVPAPFRDSFLQRNAVNVQVLAAPR
ncbi:MAG TPA: AAA family ATPase [Rubrivivax sp.]|nr:AAA family ATPase [Rubrivivax sp.]HRZ61990.1 AAA family ATPase [Rubrivivax sp.]